MFQKPISQSTIKRGIGFDKAFCYTVKQKLEKRLNPLSSVALVLIYSYMNSKEGKEKSLNPLSSVALVLIVGKNGFDLDKVEKSQSTIKRGIGFDYNLMTDEFDEETIVSIHYQAWHWF